MNSLSRFGLMTLFLLLFSLFQSGFAADPPLPTPVGRVVWVKGTLTALMSNNEKRILQKTSVIYLHDTLMTEKDTQAQIVFTDNSLMTFRESTKFNIDQYEYKQNAKDKKSIGKFVMNLIEGGFRTITGLIAKGNPPSYSVNTPVATIGVRGTDYVVYYNNGELYVGYTKGMPCVTGKDVKKTTVCLDKNTRYVKVAGDGQAPVPLDQQPFQLSEQLEIVQATIGPFQGGGGGGSTGSSRGGECTIDIGY